ncbi:protein LSM14 homolog A isoform X3 [Aethina tumida]|uniref:protein LSM14 homolog A isoform X3 n=1 Tax=Aethina tumida TaxID=116153 RepID=UPI00214800E6|nr:protein LSM14 homolog A isoform X3 [Aethina tumida]
MTSGMPELGSKISLISKADIRYEGRLFTVDPQECTIALASVRSFGTEDREAQYPVPAQSQVYDYILFRGSDIKDIRVVPGVPTHAQPLNDPAIMQLSVPPTLGTQQYQTHPVLGQMAPQMSQFANAYGNIGSAIGGLGSGLAPGMHMQRDNRNLGGNKPTSVLDLISGGGSRSTTPASLSSRKSPTNDQGTQAGGKGGDKVVKPIQPPNSNQRNQQRNKSRERKDSRGDGQNRQMQRNQNHGGAHHQGGNHYNNNQQQGQRGGWSNRGPISRPRGRPRGNFKAGGGNQGQPNQGGKVKNTLKFDNDYDFEQANTEFEELRSQLGKVKIEDGNTNNAAVKTPAEANGGAAVPAESDKKDDSGNETGQGETGEEEDHEFFYDKSKSFFDKISCEAVERAKGKSQRTDWRTERKLNSETFGVSATRRGNYRGRGGYRGMGYRGGFRGGYRQQRRDQQQPQQGNRPAERTVDKQTSVTSTNDNNTENATVQNTNASDSLAAAAAAAVEFVAANNASARTLKTVPSDSETELNPLPGSSSGTEQVSVAEPAMAVI